MQQFKYNITKLSYPIDPHHQRGYFIRYFLPMTRTFFSQQNIATLRDALEQAMQIEEIVGYPQDYKLGSPLPNPTIMGLHNQISTLTERLENITPT